MSNRVSNEAKTGVAEERVEPLGAGLFSVDPPGIQSNVSGYGKKLIVGRRQRQSHTVTPTYFVL